MAKFVAVKAEGVVEVHATSDNGTYDTLCGMDANDDTVGHEGVVELPPHPKITCAACKSILEQSWKYSKRDLA